jgi:hypothetical protein
MSSYPVSHDSYLVSKIEVQQQYVGVDLVSARDE